MLFLSSMLSFVQAVFLLDVYQLTQLWIVYMLLDMRTEWAEKWCLLLNSLHFSVWCWLVHGALSVYGMGSAIKGTMWEFIGKSRLQCYSTLWILCSANSSLGSFYSQLKFGPYVAETSHVMRRICRSAPCNFFFFSQSHSLYMPLFHWFWHNRQQY